ncbi:hypothetical protein ACOACO_05975 [Nocardioides sp. CPCC 205120]|uniref:hypothetical protein n=1 Tax=Nocardioides sp. CPCC 205120 TaxID=3406462 RepID=UPI003B514846
MSLPPGPAPRPGWGPVPLSRGRGAWIGLGVLLAVTALTADDLRRKRAAGGDVGEHWVALAALVVITLLAGAGLLLLGRRLPRYDVGPRGIALWSMRGEAEIPWEQVASVRLLHSRTRTWPHTRTLREVEVVLAPDVLRRHHPRAGGLWRQDVDAARLRLDHPGRAPGLGRSVEAVAPGRWQGEHERPRLGISELAERGRRRTGA